MESKNLSLETCYLTQMYRAFPIIFILVVSNTIKNIYAFGKSAIALRIISWSIVFKIGSWTTLFWSALVIMYKHAFMVQQTATSPSSKFPKMKKAFKYYRLNNAIVRCEMPYQNKFAFCSRDLNIFRNITVLQIVNWACLKQMRNYEDCSLSTK